MPSRIAPAMTRTSASEAQTSATPRRLRASVPGCISLKIVSNDRHLCIDQNFRLQFSPCCRRTPKRFRFQFPAAHLLNPAESLRRPELRDSLAKIVPKRPTRSDGSATMREPAPGFASGSSWAFLRALLPQPEVSAQQVSVSHTAPGFLRHHCC